jgi:hypothetical protein
MTDERMKTLSVAAHALIAVAIVGYLAFEALRRWLF